MLVKTNYVSIIESKMHFVKGQKEDRQLEKGIDRESVRAFRSAVEVHSAIKGLIAIPAVK
jgi:hypothetical protein